MRGFILIVYIFLGLNSFAVPNYLHADGKKIVDGNGNNVLLRGIGTGNWMLMEGYMMQTSGVANTMHEFKAKLTETIGVEKTDSFFTSWLDNHFTRTDVDSMKAWGFNSVRVAMHYKWFTPPIEEEPVLGEITWIQEGFNRIDSLLDWCIDNEMYLILDLHGAPGGQGKDQAISDYDPTKPSLWESTANKKKMVAFWHKLAKRYANEPWIAGYDLLNETNWPFPEGNNSQMRQLFVEVTDSIRLVDKNHIIFIEGNSFANDHSGLTPPWDNNLVYSFHKYWSSTDANSLDWIISLRDRYNVPLWFGESGENSNSWFTELISVSEANNIGWAWWPVKKSGINNVLHVETNQSYTDLIKYWEKPSENPKQTVQEAFDAVMQFAANHNIKNCKVQKGVLDAMLRQVYSDEVLPFKKHQLGQKVFFADYDYGKNGFAYSDQDIADYGDGGTGNSGWSYRNDGVDIEPCEDATTTHGYNVGFTNADEWMQYSLTTDSAALYTLDIRSASGSGGAKFHLELGGVNISGALSLPSTGGWQNWTSTQFENVLLPKGDLKLRFVFDQGGSNLNYFNFTNPKNVGLLDFEYTAVQTGNDGFQIRISVNKEITTSPEAFKTSDFTLTVSGEPVTIDSIHVSAESKQILLLDIKKGLYSNQSMYLSYQGTSLQSSGQALNAFSDVPIKKNMETSRRIPGKIQAEDFVINKGLELEDCSDAGNGKNTGYSNAGDYLIYKVHVSKPGIYKMIYRVATERSDAEMIVQVGSLDAFTAVDTMKFERTGGWQTWEAQSSSLYLKEGYYYMRLWVKRSEHNLNWFQLNYISTAAKDIALDDVKLYPNPASNYLTIDLGNDTPKNKVLSIYNLAGTKVLSKSVKGAKEIVNIQELPSGIYFLTIESGSHTVTRKLSVR